MEEATDEQSRVHISARYNFKAKSHSTCSLSVGTDCKDAKAMRHWLLLEISVLFFVSISIGQPAEKAAHADIYNAKGEKIGTATFYEVQGGVKIDVEVAPRSSSWAARPACSRDRDHDGLWLKYKTPSEDQSCGAGT